MTSGFTGDEFERAHRGAAEPGINRAMKEGAAKLQSILDVVHSEARGQPRAHVEIVLDRELRAHGYEPTAEHVSSWCSAIAEGRCIVVRHETAHL